MNETIFTEHPDPEKKGVKISRQKYDIIHEAIVAAIKINGPRSLGELTEFAASSLGDGFDGSIPWYITTVKLDMESRGELVCDRTKSPHVHELIE